LYIIILFLGPFFVCLVSTFSFICFLYFHFLWDNINFLIKAIGIGIFSIWLLSYSYTFLKNPGLPKYNYNPTDVKNKTGIDYCSICKIYLNKDKKIRHCHDCNICIEGIFCINLGYDHHCPWTSKCVGDGNICGFYIFVGSTMVLIAFLVFGLSMASIKK